APHSRSVRPFPTRRSSDLEYERVLDPRPKDPRTIAPLLRTHAELRRWRPDVVLAELVWDPRWLLLARLAPLVHLVHDDRQQPARSEEHTSELQSHLNLVCR